MKKIVFAVAATAALICNGGATATDTRTLAKFLSSCSGSARVCHGNLEDYLSAAKDQGLVCLPEDLPMERAISQELTWLRKQSAADEALANGSAEDAQWTAISTLWPCKTE